MDSTPRRTTEKRNRPPVSCEPCRSRKLKCNRELPCDTCIRRKKSSACHYAGNASRNRPTTSTPQALKDRLASLENMVSSLLSGETVIQPKESPDDVAIVNKVDTYSKKGLQDHTVPSIIKSSERVDYVSTPEPLHLQENADGQVNYIDPSHWQSVLDDIKEVREHLSVSSDDQLRNEPPKAPDPVPSDPTLVFGSSPPTDLAAILASLPPRPVCDMLLSSLFNSRFMILGILHPAKFQNEYKAFRDSPSTTPLPWIALMFSVLSIAVNLRLLSGTANFDASIPTPKVLQQKAVQCLVLGNFTTANSHAIEALLLHLQSCFLSLDHNVNLWFEMGTIIRLAFRLAYHRDPSNLTKVSAFDGEMRRRVWLNIVQLDALMSFQLGFPSMIPSEYCDTLDPRNLEYSDLHEEMQTLPPARTLLSDTPVRYTIAKSSVMAVFKKIFAHTQTLPAPTYDKTIALDVEMKQVYANMPEPLKHRNVDQSFMDPSTLIWERTTIDALYLKGLIVLHRRYINYEPQTPLFAPSRRTCVAAALDVINHQTDVHKACQPGGRLHEDRWMFFTIPIHDFLLAAMVVCLDLSVRLRSGTRAQDSTNDDQDLTNKEFNALQSSYQVWSTNGLQSPEAHMAALAIDLMIKKVAQNCIDHAATAPPLPTDFDFAFDTDLPYASTIAQMIDGSEIIDWGLLDQYFQNRDVANADFMSL